MVTEVAYVLPSKETLNGAAVVTVMLLEAFRMVATNVAFPVLEAGTTPKSMEAGFTDIEVAALVTEKLSIYNLY